MMERADQSRYSGITGRRTGYATRAGGYTLVELVVSLAVVSVIMFGITGAIMVAGRSVTTAGSGFAASSNDASEVAARIARDLHFAIDIEREGNRRIVFTVPDRDGDGAPETIRYRWGGTPGNPLKYWYNGGDEIILLDSVQDLDFDFLTRTIPGVPMEDPGVEGSAGDILLVVPDALSLTSSDLAHETLIESWGWRVNWISASALQSEFDTAIGSNNAVLVTPNVTDAALGTKLTPALIGVINSSWEMLDELEFSKNVDSVNAVDSVTMLDTTHYISGSFMMGDVVFSSVGQPCQRAASKLAPGGQYLAETVASPSDRVVSLMVVEAGAVSDEDQFGNPTAWAAERRVLLPWGLPGFDVTTLNNNGKAMLRRAIEWAAYQESTGTFGYETEFATPVNDVDDTQIATRATLSEPATVVSLSAYVNSQGRKMRMAIYDDNAGEPGSLVTSTDVFKEAGLTDPAWHTQAVAPVSMTPGDYWLVISFDRNNQIYYQEGGGETRYRNHNAVKNGYLSTWGPSDNNYSISISIYANYLGD